MKTRNMKGPNFFSVRSCIRNNAIPDLLSCCRKEAIDNLMRTYHQYGLFNGSVLVAEKGRVILKKGYGLANLEHRIPITPKTVFDIASVSKQFTSMGIVLLHLRGELNIDDDIRI